jgi:hypothetical protein
MGSESAAPSTGRRLRQRWHGRGAGGLGYYSAAFCGPIRRVGVRFSVTVTIDPKAAAAIADIG